MFNLVLFGPPGSGKGTQSENIIATYKLQHISTGDLLRSEVTNQTTLGLEAKKFMDQGMLVPDEVVIGMISSRIDESGDARGFVFDGFPRTEAQALALDKLLEFKGTSINLVLSLEVEEQQLIKRLAESSRDIGCTGYSRIGYGYDSLPWKGTVTGSKKVFNRRSVLGFL